MRNSTLKQSGFFRLSIFIVFLLLSAHNVSAQFYTKHYIAPAPWQYFSKANEIVIATNSTSTVNIAVSRSNGTLVTNLTAVKGAPAVYRFAGLPKDAPAHALNTVLNAAGLIINADAPVSINLRNVASDALGGDGSDKDIKGNAALTSFGDAGIGIRFRIGYYRDGSLGNFGDFGDQRPIYSIMATADNTTVKVNNAIVATLNTGQSYLFKANIGTLVESSNPSVMNTSAAIDTPNGCGDGAYNQIPPEAVLGTEYFIERGKGNDTAEQTTVVATKDNTALTINTYSTTGDLVGTNTLTLPTAGSFYTFRNGVSNSSFSASRVAADKRVAVYSGTARSCEVDIYTIAPVSECGGSNFVETAKFRDYGTGSLPYFGYILLRSATEVVSVNGTNIETISGISARHQLGSTGWYVINFEDTQIGSPNILSISSAAKLTVSIVQQGGGFTMAGFFSNFAIQPEDPTFTYVSGGGCTNNTATLTTASGLSPYQWYLNGVAINGANSDTYTATKTGAYSVASTLTCGAQTQSKPVSVTLCTDLEVKKTVNIATPCVGSNVEFTVALNNLGVNNSTGVSVNDLLPTGYTFVSSTASVGSYNSTTGVWSIGDVNGGAAETLKITAKVNASGVYNNIASLPSTIVDSNSTNNSASVSTTPNPLPTLTINNPASVCSPSTVNLTAPAVTAGSSSNLTFTYWTNSTATTAYTTPTAATAGTYYIKATTTSGCSDIKPVIVKVATPPNAGTLSGTQSICVGNNTTFSSNGNTGGAWTSSDTSIATVTSAGVVNGLSAGTATITYRVTGTGGCSDATSTRTVTVTAAPNAGTLSGTQTICVGNNTTFSSNGNTGGAWTSSDTSIATVTSAGVVNGLSAGTATITYRVTGTGGCSDATSTRTVTVNAMPAAPAASSQSFCSTDAKKVSDLLPSGSAYKWYDVATAGTALQATDVLTTKTYYVSETLNGCEGPRRSVAVTVTTTPSAPTLSTITQPTCFSATGSFTITNYNSSYTYTVTPSTGVTRVNDIVTVPSGSYTIKASINSCETSTNFTVNSQICAVAETFPTSVNGLPGGDTTESLILGDKLNNAQAVIGTNPGQVSISPVTVPTGFTINTDGTVKVPANTKAGDYNVEYSICEINNTNNCSTATSVVKVSAPVILAVAETFPTAVNGLLGGDTTESLILGDKLNSAQAVIGTNPGQVSISPVTVPTGFTINTDGTVKVPANTKAGDYNVEYSICEINNTNNCSTATSVVKVSAPVILAVAETFPTVVNGLPGGDTTEALILGDKLNNAQAVIGTNPGQVSISPVTVPTGFTINNDGTVKVPANTKAGDYNVEYSICEINNTNNCSTATSVVKVSAPVILAVAETFPTAVNGLPGGNTTESLILGDKLNNAQAVIGTNPGQVSISPVTVPTGFTINTDGTVKVPANTKAGDYNVEYSICEINNINNCSTATSVVKVIAPVILAVAETFPTAVNGLPGGDTTESLILGDKLNNAQAVIGTNPGQVSISPVTVPTGFTINNDGTVKVPANTKAGDYNVEYSICEINNTNNCSTATSVVKVSAPVILAVAETFPTAVNGLPGGNTTESLILGDKLNNAQAVIGTNPGQVSISPVTVPTGFTINNDGTVKVPANTKAGDYNVEYSICEINNTNNCSTATSVVKVSAPVIDAVGDNVTSINGNIGGTTVALSANDTLNGNPIIVGIASGEVTLNIIGTLPTGLTLNADYTITVAPNTPAANYNVEYKICENNNPTNCDSITITIPVTVGNLIANVDLVSGVIASNASQTLGTNVLDNDTKNGLPLNPSDVTLSTLTPDPTGYLVLNPDGILTLKANAPAGNYELTYQICEKLNTGNCDSNTVKVSVSLPVIDAVGTTLIPSINGSIGGTTTTSVVENDTLNGNPFVLGNLPGQVKLTAVNVPSGLTLNADGTVTVLANTPAGVYNVEYSICEITNPTNCDTAISKVAVNNGVLVANTDTIPSRVGSEIAQPLGINVLDNDTKNGLPLNPSDVTLTTSTPDPSGYLVLNPDGTVTLGANPPVGTYEVTYTICENLNPGNCSSNTVKITVDMPVIDAVSETLTPSITGSTGGKTTSSVIENDKINGKQAVIGNLSGQVKLTAVNVPSGLTLNADGTVTVAINTPSGIYNIEYSICEISNPTNCDSAISKVAVNNGVLVANTDLIPSITASNTPQTFGVNVFDNDTKDGLKLNPSDVTLSTSTPDPKGYLVLNPNGTLTLGANAPAGNYDLTYTICEKLNAGNCSSNTVRVIVDMPVIDAVADPVTSISGNIGGTTISLIANDKLNGSPVVVGTAPGEVTFALIGTLPTGLTLNPDFTITVAPNTPAGNYNVEYSICDNINSTNCDSVISVITVSGGNLIANQDIVPSAVGVNVPQTLINVFVNDTKDGNALVPSDVNLNVTIADPKGYLTVDANGNAILAPNAPAGDYELTYTICEKLNPLNCNSNVVKVTVTEPKMTVTANSYCSNNVPYVNYTVTPDNFTTNNKLTVKWIDSSNNVVATQTNLDLSGNLIWPGAIVDGNGNGVDWPGWVLNNGQWMLGADGFEGTRNGVKMEFSLNPTVTVSVSYPVATAGCNPNPSFSITANNDEAGPIDVKKGTDATINIFNNDILNGVKPTPSDIVLSTVVANPNLVLNADGSVTILANTPSGVYQLTYQICEAANTSNCSQAVVKITVVNNTTPAPPTSNAITLVNDDNIIADGINGDLEFVNVLNNDLISGQPINPADVTIKALGNNSNFEFNPDGTVNVKPNTPGGNYAITYQVCEKANATNCATAVLNVFVEVPAIAIIKTAEFNDLDKSGFANAGETITYKFTVTNTGNVPLINVTVKDPLTGVVVSGQAISLAVGESNNTNFTAVYKITQEDINIGKVTNQATAHASSTSKIVVEDKSDDLGNDGDNPTVLSLDGCSIKVFNAFSPNGDAKNARFFIRGIECYPNNTVEIYNRWGVLVYSIDQYDNNDRVFVGYSNGRSTIKQTEGLPVGTYFYILKYQDSSKTPHEQSGYLYINK